MSYKHHHAKRKPVTTKSFARGDYGGSDFVNKLQKSEIIGIGGSAVPNDPTSSNYYGLNFYLPEKRDEPYQDRFIDKDDIDNKEASNFRGYELVPTASDLTEQKPRSNVWALNQEYQLHSLWGSYVFPCHKATQMITPDELTAQGLVAGDKFTRLKQRVWGDFLNDEDRLPKGVRIRMFHLNTEISDTTDSTLTAFETKMAEMRMPDTKDPYKAVIVYQDKTTTKFPPLLDAFTKTKAAFDQVLSHSNVTDYYSSNSNYLSTYRGNFRLKLSQEHVGRNWYLEDDDNDDGRNAKGRPIGGGAARLQSVELPYLGSGLSGFSSGEGYEVCVDFGTGDAPDADCHDDFFNSAEQKSSFTWNGLDPIIVEVATFYNSQNFEPNLLINMLSQNINNRDLQVRTDFRSKDPFQCSLASFKTQPYKYQRPTANNQTYTAIKNNDTYNFGIRFSDAALIDTLLADTTNFSYTAQELVDMLILEGSITLANGYADSVSYGDHRKDPDTGASRLIKAANEDIPSSNTEAFMNKVNGYQLRPQLKAQDLVYYKFTDNTYTEYKVLRSGNNRRNNELKNWDEAGVVRSNNKKLRNWQDLNGRKSLQARDGIQNVVGAIRLEVA